MQGVISLKDNVSATLQGIRKEQSKFKQDVAAARKEMEKTYKKEYKARIDNAPATKAIKELSRKMEPLRKKLVTIIAAKDMATAKVNKVKNQVKAVGKMVATPVVKLKDMASKGLSKIGGVLKGVGGAALVAGGMIASGAAMGLKAYVPFDDTMRSVLAKSQASEEEYKALREQAKELGATTRFSAAEAAKGQEYMAMAGWNASQIMAAMPAALDLAAASGEELGTVSDILTDSMTAFGLKAQDAQMYADVLAKTATKTNTNVGLMGETFKYVAPVAGALGVSAQETATMVGLMANAGIKGSNAGTALRSALSNLAAPPKMAAKAIAELGLQTKKADGSFTGMESIVKQLQDKFKGLTNVQQAAYSKALFGQEAMSGMMAVINQGPEAFDNLKNEIDNAGGSAKAMADTMNGGIGGAMAGVKSAFEGMLISFTEQNEGAILAAMEGVTKLLGFLSTIDLSALGTKIKDAIAEFVPAINSLSLEGVKESFMSSIGAVTSWIAEKFGWIAGETGFFKEVISSAIGAINPVFNTLKAIAMPVLDALAAAVRIVYEAFKFAFPAVKAVITNVWDSIQPILNAIVEAIGWVSEKVKGVADWMSGAANKSGKGKQGKSVDGSHFSGLKAVPYDGYIAELHKGEAVIPAKHNPFNGGNVINFESAVKGIKNKENNKVATNNIVVQSGLQVPPTVPLAAPNTSNVTHVNSQESTSNPSIAIEVNIPQLAQSIVVEKKEDIEALANQVASRVTSKMVEALEKQAFNKPKKVG